jgi:HemY protein
MRKLIAALIILLLSVGAALWLHRQGGLVIINVGEWTLQTSVLFFAIVLVAGIILLYALIAFLRELLGVPRRLRGWSRRRREHKARAHLVQGLLRLAEGRNSDAERLLTRDVDRSDSPLLHYLTAAVAAQRQGEYERRDRYLALADKARAKATLAVGLIQAQLQIESRQWEQALATLNYLSEISPNHPRVVAMLLKCCEALKEWDRIDALLPVARKQNVVDDAEARRLAREVALHRLQQAARSGDPAALDAAWSSLGKPLRQEPELLQIYTEGLVRAGRAEEAERVLRTQLGREHHAQLARLYGALPLSAPEPALAQVEKWLRERPEDPALLQAAGRLALQAKLWGRARGYLDAAAARQPDPVTLHLLGSLLEQLGEIDAARERYRQALEQSVAPAPLRLSDAEQRALAQVRADE